MMLIWTLKGWNGRSKIYLIEKKAKCYARTKGNTILVSLVDLWGW